jgi:hypothetical protein
MSPRNSFLLSLALLAAPIGACSSEATSTAAGAGASSSSSSLSSSSTTASTSASSGGGGELCGTDTCNRSETPFEFCQPLDGSCGADDPTLGECVEIPPGCLYPPWTWEPTCYCDGAIQAYDCQDAPTTADLTSCSEIRCGSSKCDKTTEYCEVVLDANNPEGTTPVTTCRPLPVGCVNSPSCECMAAEPCSGYCQGTAEGGFQLACNVPEGT